jgi:hypothetical protein
MTRRFGIYFETLSRRPALGDGGGLDTQAGTRGVGTQYNPHASNIIRFPSGRTFLPDSRASERELSISDDTCALCAVGVLFGFFILAIALLTFAGVQIFNLVDLS